MTIADDVRALGGRLVAACSTPPAARPQAEWLELVALCQQLIDTACAAQDAAIARAVSIEHDWADDGTPTERHHGLGHVSLDGPDLVAMRLHIGHQHAGRRVDEAVALAADTLVDVPTATGLGLLHERMTAGRLDAYRAGVVAAELTGIPAAVVRAVVAGLADHLTDTGPVLRRRTRRLLARIAPEHARTRTEAARRECGLRRWVADPGVDAWAARLPVEQAAPAWAAIDSLARSYVAEDRCADLEGARGQALTDLVTGAATGTYAVRLTTALTPAVRPAEGPAAPGVANERGADGSPDDLVGVVMTGSTDARLVPRGWLDATLAAAAVTSTHGCAGGTGALLDEGDELATTAYRPGERLAALVRDRDGRCRFPGCAVAAVWCDLDHPVPWPRGPTAAANLMCLCRRHHRIKQSPGWRVRLGRDGVATWTDPLGGVHVSRPVDRLEAIVLPSVQRSGLDAMKAGVTEASPAGGGASTARTPVGVRSSAPASAPASAPRAVPRQSAGDDLLREHARAAVPVQRISWRRLSTAQLGLDADAELRHLLAGVHAGLASARHGPILVPDDPPPF